MAAKPMNINKHARDIAAQRAGEAHVEASFEIGSVSVLAGERLDVEGVSYVFAYGGGAVSAHDGPEAAATSALLSDRAGTAVSVTTAQLIEVRGVRFISFASPSVVVYTG